MCINLLQSHGQQQNHSKAKFPSNLNCRQKFLVKQVPGRSHQKHPNHLILLSWSSQIMLILPVMRDHFAVKNKFRGSLFYPLAPGRSGSDSKNGIFNLVLLIGIFGSSHDNALRWMPEDLADDKSTLVQVMAWCRWATSHCLNQCWLSSFSSYGVARPQWVPLHLIF